MISLFRTHFKLARTAIKANRARSFLTCLGISIGVASIILILSLMGSISSFVQNEISNIGEDLVVVRPSNKKDNITGIVEELTKANSFVQSSLNLTDVSAISKIEGVSAVAPIAVSTNTVSSDKNTLPSVPILGTTPDFIKIEPFAIRHGSFLSAETEGNKTAKPVVLGHTLSLSLFNTVNSTVGNTLTIMGEKFLVVGVLGKIDQTITFDNIDFDNALIMNAGHLSSLVGAVQVQQINIKAKTTSGLDTLSYDIERTLVEQKHGDLNFSIAYGNAITHPASSLFAIISGMLTLVAAISLIVGGVGIMNIMLVSVSERNHEIGIRKAVGASSRNILMQFLLEALILSILGGALGLLLGFACAVFVSSVTPFPPFLSPEIILVTFLTALAIGIIFGIYPALKAASKSPIESLKHYR